MICDNDIRWTIGGPEKLLVEEFDIPDPNDDQVLIKVHACGIVYILYILAQGKQQHKKINKIQKNKNKK